MNWAPSRHGPFLVPKHGSLLGELEDAALCCPPDQHTPLLRLAMADGATESMLSGMWARVLTQEFCHGHWVSNSFSPQFRNRVWRWLRGLARQRNRPQLASEMSFFLEGARESFDNSRDHYVKSREREGRPLKWYELEGVERGAHATFLGLALRAKWSGTTGTYWACACGDTCLFHIRKDRLNTAFPLSSSADFNTRPPLLGSIAPRPAPPDGEFTLISGQWRRGDRFLVATDALASWFLSAHEKARTPWYQLCEVEDDEAFVALVDGLRSQGTLKNDDTSLFCLNP